jgi:hypothetical protein
MGCPVFPGRNRQRPQNLYKCLIHGFLISQKNQVVTPNPKFPPRGRVVNTPLLKCLGPEASNRVMQEIHEGICSNHIGPRTLAQKVFRQGYWWPTVLADSEKYVLSCTRCQEFAKVSHAPATPIVNIVSLWPFMQWGMDLVGPLPQASR